MPPVQEASHVPPIPPVENVPEAVPAFAFPDCVPATPVNDKSPVPVIIITPALENPSIAVTSSNSGHDDILELDWAELDCTELDSGCELELARADDAEPDCIAPDTAKPEDVTGSNPEDDAANSGHGQ